MIEKKNITDDNPLRTNQQAPQKKKRGYFEESNDKNKES